MKKFLVAVLSVVLCLGMFACNDGPKSQQDVLMVTIEDSQAELSLTKKLSDAFKEKKKAEGKDIEIKRSTFNTGDYGKGISTLYATGTLGDVIFTYDTYASQYSENEMFEDLDPYLKRDNIDMSLYNETIIDTARAYKNQLSYFPRSYDQVTIFINNDFFRDMGMEDKIPKVKDNGSGEYTWEWWTWSELINLCSELREAINNHYSAAQAEYYYPLDANLVWNAVYDPIIKSFGGYTVDASVMDSGFNKDNPDTDAYNCTIKALEFIKSLISQKYTVAGYGAFAAGNQAMGFMTRPSVSSVLDAGIDLSFAPVPVFDTGIDGISDTNTSYVGYGSAGYALNKNSNNKELAWDFIKFVISEEGQNIIASDGRCVPTLKAQLNPNGDWTKYVKDKDGNVVDQSAFLYDGNTLSLATYARGVVTETEYSIYSKIRSNLLGQLEKKSASDAAAYVYNQIKTYIK